MAPSKKTTLQRIKTMKYGLQNIETGEIVITLVSMRDFLDHFPKGLDEDNRKSFKIVNLK